MKSLLRSACVLSLLLAACSSNSSQHQNDMQITPELDMAAGSTHDLAAGADMPTSTPPDFAGLPDGGPAGDMAMTTIATIAVSSTLVDVAGGAPVAGAMICVYQHPELACATSDASGAFTAHIPASANTGILIDKSGYTSVLIAIQTSTNDLSGSTTRLPTSTSTQSFYTAAGASYPDPGKGFLGVSITLGNGPSGYGNTTVSVVPASGSGPYYAGTSGTYDNALTSTSSYGLARFAALAPAATLEVDAHCGTGTTESNQWGWPPASGSRTMINVPIVPGYETRVGFGCY